MAREHHPADNAFRCDHCGQWFETSAVPVAPCKGNHAPGECCHCGDVPCVIAKATTLTAKYGLAPASDAQPLR
jgi:hypothetical protein